MECARTHSTPTCSGVAKMSTAIDYTPSTKFAPVVEYAKDVLKTTTQICKLSLDTAVVYLCLGVIYAMDATSKNNYEAAIFELENCLYIRLRLLGPLHAMVSKTLQHLMRVSRLGNLHDHERMYTTMLTEQCASAKVAKTTLSQRGAVDAQAQSDHQLDCVVIGDAGVGKTSLIKAYLSGSRPGPSDNRIYIPTIFDTYTRVKTIGRQQVLLTMWDTAGDARADLIRPRSYQMGRFAIICFSVNSPESLENVRTKWLPELRLKRLDIPWILVGTKIDEESDHQITREQGENVATALHAAAYVEVSIYEPDKVSEMLKCIKDIDEDRVLHFDEAENELVNRVRHMRMETPFNDQIAQVLASA